MEPITQTNPYSSQPSSSPGLDYKRILFRALRFWYFVALSFVIGLVIAHLINRYTTRIYPVSAAIIIRESEERADARFIYNNPLANPYRNFFNEPYIIKSYPLIQGVIEDLNFQVIVQKEGNFKTTEQYAAVPVIIKCIGSSDVVTGSFIFQVLDERTFRCSSPLESRHTAKSVFSFGDTIDYQGNRLLVLKKGSVSSIIGGKYIVQILDARGIASSYIGRMKVNWALQGSSVVNLEINGAIPQKEVDFLGQLIRNYQAYDLEKKNQAASSSIAFINEQLKIIGDSLSFFERQLQSFKQENIITDMSGETLRLYGEIEALESQKVNLLISENYYGYIEEYLKRGKDFEQVILPSSVGITDPILNQLLSRLVDTQLILKGPSQKEKNNPLVQKRFKQLDELELNVVESISSLRNTDKIKRTFLERQIKALEKQLNNLPPAERRLVNIRRNYSLSESIYIFLMQKRAEAGISKASNTSDIVIVNPPSVNGGPITPKVMQNYMLFGGLGLFLPFLVFYLAELLNTRVQSKEDIEKLTSIPFIGGIGHKNIDSNLVMLEKPKSALAESFRAMRSNLNYFTEGKSQKVILVTSSLSGEGKTFTTINLAIVFALSEKRVLIIGADMRRPKLFKDFGLNNDVGLSTYLSGLATVPDIIKITAVSNLHLISSGPVPPNPSELILSSRMDELITQLKGQYDFILVDTPPIALVTDGFVLTKYADHNIFLVRQNYTPKAMLKAIEDSYQQGKLRNMSLAFNDIRVSGPGYGYGGYGYGYDYGYGYGYDEGGSYYEKEGPEQTNLFTKIKKLFR